MPKNVIYVERERFLQFKWISIDFKSSIDESKWVRLSESLTAKPKLHLINDLLNECIHRQEL